MAEKPKYPIKHSIIDLIEENTKKRDELEQAKKEAEEKNSLKKIIKGMDELEAKKYTGAEIRKLIDEYTEESE